MRTIEEMNCMVAKARGFDTYGISRERLAEICQAEREGRLVVLPCKVGDTVYFIKSAFSMAAFPIEAKVVSMRGINCDDEPMYSAITNYNGLDRYFNSAGIGKTVFLTRETAEAALERSKA